MSREKWKEKWKKRNEERYRSMLERIFDSDYAKEWMKAREEAKNEEVEFYGRELTEQELKTHLLDNFLEQDLKDIVAVLPETWEKIKEAVKDELEFTVLQSPEKLEEYVSGRTWTQYVEVPFSLGKYLGDLQDDLQKTLKKRYEKAVLEGTQTDYCPKCKVRIMAVEVVGQKAVCPQCGAYLGAKGEAKS